MPQAINDQISLSNMALGFLGTGKQIASFTEKSAEARACSLYYDTAKDEVLRAFAWPFATLTASLNLVAQNPTYEWGYAYRLPDDCLSARRILSATTQVAPFPSVFTDNLQAPYNPPLARIMTAQNRIPYRIMADASGGLLYCDIAPVAAIAATATTIAQPQIPQLEYTAEQDSPQFYAADFCMALSYRLASLIAPQLTSGDKFQRGEKAYQQYQIAIARAQANAGNEEQADQLPESEAIRARG